MILSTLVLSLPLALAGCGGSGGDAGNDSGNNAANNGGNNGGGNAPTSAYAFSGTRKGYSEYHNEDDSQQDYGAATGTVASDGTFRFVSSFDAAGGKLTDTFTGTIASTGEVATVTVVTTNPDGTTSTRRARGTAKRGSTRTLFEFGVSDNASNPADYADARYFFDVYDNTNAAPYAFTGTRPAEVNNFSYAGETITTSRPVGQLSVSTAGAFRYQTTTDQGGTLVIAGTITSFPDSNGSSPMANTTVTLTHADGTVDSFTSEAEAQFLGTDGREFLIFGGTATQQFGLSIDAI